jgi:hypothetical protein
MIFQNVLLTATIICSSIFSPDPDTSRYGELFCSAPSQMVFRDIPSSPDLTPNQISNMFLEDAKSPAPGLIIFYCSYQCHDLIVTIYRYGCDIRKASLSIMNFGPVKRANPGVYPDMKFYNDFLIQLLSFPGIVIERMECVGVQ